MGSALYRAEPPEHSKRQTRRERKSLATEPVSSLDPHNDLIIGRAPDDSKQVRPPGRCLDCAGNMTASQEYAREPIGRQAPYPSAYVHDNQSTMGVMETNL